MAITSLPTQQSGFHVTGPIQHFVSFPGDTTAYYLGSAATSPLIKVDRTYLPIMMEQGGYVLPFDLAYQGKQAKVLTTINNFVPQLMYLIGCSPRYGRTSWALGEGLDSWMDVGSLMLGNQCWFSLYLRFAFAFSGNDINIGRSPLTGTTPNIPNPNPGTLPEVARGMPLWYRFPACMVEYDNLTGGAGEAEQRTVGFHAQRIYYSRGKFASGLQGIIPIPTFTREILREPAIHPLQPV